MKEVVIIGNGISGITAARYIRKKSDFKITVISAESDYFFSRTALMYIYMGHMRYEHTKPYEDNFWQENKIALMRAYVSKVEPRNKSVLLADGRKLSYDVLIIACGSKPNMLDCPGIGAKGVQGLVTLQDLEAMEANTQNATDAVVVGGGLIGIEMAEMLRSRNIGVTMLIREPEFWSNVLPMEEAAMVSRHILDHGIKLKKETELREIIVDEGNSLKGIVTGSGELIPCQFAGITIGVSPRLDFLRDSGIALDKGVLVNEFFETDMPDVFAIGDCAQFKKPLEDRKAVEQVWYTGRMHGETLAHTICGKRTAYRPGTWFNSAKFLDIEYQVYGKINPRLAENERAVFWQHPNHTRAVRIVYHKENRNVLGFNLLGIRYRHAVCADWIEKKTDIKEVLLNLKAANFDPEFHRTYEDDILAAYNVLEPDDPVVKEKRRKVLGLF